MCTIAVTTFSLSFFLYPALKNIHINLVAKSLFYVIENLERGEEYVKWAENIKINLRPKNNIFRLYTLILKLKANLFGSEQHDIIKI